MKQSFLLAMGFIIASPVLAIAQTWTTPDGFLVVTPPDLEKFDSIPTPPAPFVGLWESKDQTMKFGVMQMEVPEGIKFDGDAGAEGLSQELGAPVTDMSTRNVNGFDVWKMTATNEAAEITQAILQRDRTLYKVMAATIGGEPDAETVNRFIDSVTTADLGDNTADETVDGDSVNVQDSEPLNVGEEEGDMIDHGAPADFHNLSKTLGGVGALLLIGLLVYKLTVGKKATQA